MSMKISGKQELFGVRAIELRNAFKSLDDKYVSPRWFARRLKISQKKANRLCQDLLKAGWLKPDDTFPKTLVLCGDGWEFRHARATRPIKRTTANRLLEGAIQAAKDINADGSITHFVEVLYVFGSYLGDESEIGDLDIGYRLRQRRGRMNGDDFVKWCARVGRVKGNCRDYFSMIGYSELQVMRRLKQRSTYVALHSINDLDTIKAERKLVFKKGRVAAPKREV